MTPFPETQVPVSWIYERSRRRGAAQIPHFKLGKYLRFSEQAVLKWLESLENNGF
jgi:predicted DNA-binding transcriptional regulator AlpA